MNIEGSVSGDVVGGDKIVTQTAGGDIVGGHQVTQTGTGHIFTGAGNVLVVQQQVSPASERDRANLLVLLDKVRTFWVEGVLQRSIHDALLIELGRELRPNEVDHPWASVLELPDATRRELPAAASDIQIFDEANRALLILGAPGSGKTTTLLEIARDLAARAAADRDQPIPVVFNLSSWNARRGALGRWLAAELSTRYQIPPSIGSRWLAEQRLLPLFDGLDEVAPAAQAACVAALNNYTAGQGLPGLVVCCRTEEYTRLPVRLRLNAAISLSPLTPAQIDQYLAAGGDRLAALRALMGTDEALAVLAQTPLFLAIMCLAYQGLAPDAVANPALRSVAQRRQHLFEHYVNRMLKRKGRTVHRFPDTVLLNWLAWLARNMAGNNQTVFVSERMQPSWLENAGGRWAYALASRVSLWVCLSLGFAVTALAILQMLAPSAPTMSAYLASSLAGEAWRLRFQVLAEVGWQFAQFGLLAGLVCGARFALAARRGPVAAPRRTPGRAAFNVLAAIVLPVVVIGWPSVLRALTAPNSRDLTLGTLFNGLLIMLAAAVALRGWRSDEDPAHDIPNVDNWDWSRLKGLRGIVLGGLAGALPIGACLWAITPDLMTQQRLLSLMLCAVPLGLLGGLVGGIIAGLRLRAAPLTAAPERPLLRHTRNAVTAGIILGLAITLAGLSAGYGMFALVPEFLLDTSPWRVFTSSLGLGLTFGVVIGCVAALHYGGAALIQLAVLRLILVLQRRTPWRLGRMADQAEDLVFLRRVGGGYIFIHRLIMEYFASAPVPGSANGQREPAAPAA